MAESKPQTASGYDALTSDLLVRTTLHLATVLGEYADDLVIVGGLVPIFLVDQAQQPYEQRHIGSRDVDLGLNQAIRDDKEKYESISNSLKRAGFHADRTSDGNPIRQRWRHEVHTSAVVEFLMDTGGEPRKLQSLTGDLAAANIPGLSLAFHDRFKYPFRGLTLDMAIAERDFYVCGAGAFLILKGLALHGRSEGKDAYDIDYVVRNSGKPPAELAACIRSLLNLDKAREGLTRLRENFETLDHIGPVKLARFLDRAEDENLRADCSALVMEVVRQCE